MISSNFLAALSASSALFTSLIKTNSSPPRRDSVSDSRMLLLMRSDARIKSASPISCPKVSLIFLKKSISNIKIAVFLLARVDAAKDLLARISNNFRFGAPVNASCRAMNSNFILDSLRSKTCPICSLITSNVSINASSLSCVV